MSKHTYNSLNGCFDEQNLLVTNVYTIANVDAAIDDAMSTIKISKTDDLTYSLEVDGKDSGEIVIPEDQFLETATYDDSTHTLALKVKTASEDKEIYINLENLVDVYKGGGAKALRFPMTALSVRCLTLQTTRSALILTSPLLKRRIQLQ